MIEFTATERGDLHARVALNSWRGARDASGPYASPLNREASGDIDIVIRRSRSEREGKGPPSEREKQCVQFLLENEQAISAALLTSIRDEYPSIRGWLLTCAAEDEVAKIAPPATSLEDVRRLAGPGVVFVMPSHAGEAPYFGFGLGCTWDVEHGLGAMMRGAEPVRLGSADVSFNEHLPDDDRILRNLTSLLGKGGLGPRYTLSRRQALWKHAPWRLTHAQPDLGVYDEKGALVLGVDVADFHWQGPSRWAPHWAHHFIPYRNEPAAFVLMTISSKRPEVLFWKRTSESASDWAPIREVKGVDATCSADEIGLSYPIAGLYSSINISRE